MCGNIRSNKMIINQVVKGSGGSAPASYRAFQVDNNGKLVNSTSTPWVPFPAGTTDLEASILYQAYKETSANVLSGSIDLSSLTTISGSAAMNGCFQSCTGITSVDLSSLTTVSGGSGLANCFSSCTGITSVDLSSLTTVSGSGALNYMFNRCTGLTSVDLSSLNTVSATNALGYCFSGCTGLTSVNLSSLTTISSVGGFSYCFQSCTGITSVDLSSLTTISNTNSMSSCFYGCTSLTSVDLSSLTTIKGSNCMASCFAGCTSLTTLSFPSLNSNSFGSYTNQFVNMLASVTGCTVHFPMAIQSTIGSWTDVTGGFAGTNTTVLFDIVTSLTGADSNTYTRKQKESTSTATAWTYNDTLYYTSGTTEPSVGDTIYSDSACTTTVTTISAIA